jgi:hypothetical protein
MNFIYEMNESPLQFPFSYRSTIYVANLTKWFEEHVSIPSRRNPAQSGAIRRNPATSLLRRSRMKMECDLNPKYLGIITSKS